jgi:hypothetical protein
MNRRRRGRRVLLSCVRCRRRRALEGLGSSWGLEGRKGPTKEETRWGEQGKNGIDQDGDQAQIQLRHGWRLFPSTEQFHILLPGYGWASPIGTKPKRSAAKIALFSYLNLQLLLSTDTN